MANSHAVPDTHLALPPSLARGPSRRWALWLLVGVSVAATIVVVALRRAPSASTEQYRTAAVARRTVIRVVEATGHLDVMTRVEVPAPAPGRLSEIFVKAGATVAQGQPLAQLDDEAASAAASGARASLRAADGRVAEARAALAAATDVRERTEALAARGLASAGEVANVRATEARADAALKAARATLSGASASASAAELDRQRRTVRAPVSGTLLTAPRWSGAVVGPEHGPLAVIGSDPGLLRIDASVAEADIGPVRVGQEAAFTVPAFPDRTFRARVEERAGDRESAGGAPSYLVTLSAPNSDRALLPGMTTTVRIEVTRAENAMVVREAALRFSPERATDAPPRSRVFRVEPGGSIAPVEVSPGVSDGAYTEVVPRDPQSLHPGDVVVIGLPLSTDEGGPGPGITLGKRP